VTKTNIISVLSAIGNLSTNGIFCISLRKKALIYFNDALLRIFDISHKQFANEPAFFINHIIPEELHHLNHEYEKLLADSRIENVEFKIKSHEASIKDVLLNTYLLENKKYAVGVLRDISNVREHESYIINYGSKKDTLLDTITHNLTGPLSISKNVIASLENAAREPDVKNLNAHIQIIKDSTSQCIDIINEFLEEEHSVSEHIYVKKNRFEVVTKLEDALQRFKKSYPDYNFILQKEEDVIYVTTDEVKFLQVMNNLLSNAIKWSPSGSTIETILDSSGDMLIVHVKDHGIGLPEHLKPFIFQKYSAASREGLQGEKSIGMGLYIVKQLVNLMKGSISFVSNEGRGTTFTLKLPKEDVSNQ
jgi:two-component system sensor histidine kinase VicK